MINFVEKYFVMKMAYGLDSMECWSLLKSGFLEFCKYNYWFLSVISRLKPKKERKLLNKDQNMKCQK